MQTNTKLVLLWQNKFAYMKIQIEYSAFVIDWSQFQSKTEYILQFHSPYLNRAHDKNSMHFAISLTLFLQFGRTINKKEIRNYLANQPSHVQVTSMHIAICIRAKNY